MTSNPTGSRAPERDSSPDEAAPVKSLSELIEELARLASSRATPERRSG